jgi:1-acyl-sn-glycerol-3-phosphate acyltransferase
MVNLFLFPFRKLYVVYWPQNGTKQSKWIRRGMRFFGGIVSDREANSMRFIDESVKTLEKGRLVQIYPEAHITYDGEMHEFKPSYLLIALRAEVPIIPVMIDGNYGIFKRAHVMIGKPIDPWSLCTSDDPTREELMEMNRIVFEKSKDLKAELMRRVEADRRKGRKDG